MLTKYGLPVAALALLIFAIMHVLGAQKDPPTPPPYVEPARSPYQGTVSGAGMVEPQTENISIGSSVPGVVVSVPVKVGQTVAAGDELFRLDDRQLRAESLARKAALAAAQADLIRLENSPRPEMVRMSTADVAEADARVTELEDQLTRTRKLVVSGAVSQESLIQAEQTLHGAKARLNHMSAENDMQKAGAWEYDKRVAQAAIDKASALVAQIETELDRLVTRALVPCEVLQVNVRPGEYVHTPPTTPLIVLGNVNKLHVRVDVDEYDIHRFSQDAPAKAALRGNPSETFDLQFVRVEPYVIPKKSLTGDKGERVDTRVLQVIYAITEPARRLYVGQQLDVFIEAVK
jgi:multidrug resistance efflux pump